MTGPQQRQGRRLTSGAIDFSFNGTRYKARAGDTVAAALIANGVRLIGRSVKARRRRGILTAGPEEPNALLTVVCGRELIPNVAATQLIVTEGLEVRSQNTWPSPDFDLASVLQLGGGVFSAGFYYKTFFWPSWKAYEPLIRRLAGLGPAPRSSSLPPPLVEHLSCDVLVAGAGPAGLFAARTAARTGATVVVCEREPFAGGELEFETATLEGLPAADWIRATLAELTRLDVRLLTDTTVVGSNGKQFVAHCEPGGIPCRSTVYKIRTRQFTIAMGAVERPMVFAENDLPGVMLLGAAERYLARYGVAVGRDVVICTNHNRAYAAAARLSAGGMRIRMVVDSRSDRDIRDPTARTQRDALIRSGVECRSGYFVAAATGRTEVRGAEIVTHSGSALRHTVTCDCILTSSGWTPALHAATQSGGEKSYASEIAAFVPGKQPHNRLCIGAAQGTFELGEICNDAHGDPAPELIPFWRAKTARSQEKRQYVDFQNDVTVADLRVAMEEGFTDIEHAKRYTALGFGTDQGRLGGTNGAAILAELQNRPVAEVGTSRLRAPYQPMTLRSLAGVRSGTQLRVTRLTPLHEWHVDHGAVMESTGLWQRPRCYARDAGASPAVAYAEARRVRERGGVSDASTLGKIEICGPDAGAFLDYVYLTRASTLPVGRSRYGVNLREDGMVLDDGLILRLAADRFRVTTSTGHAEHMLSHFEFWRATAWSSAKLAITDVTDAWSTIAIAGPDSRDTLLKMVDAQAQATVAALKHMEFTHASYNGFPVVILRATFSGELGFEIHCPPEQAVALWQTLVGGGLQPYGLEAMDVLRIEKGYLTHAEISGQTTPYDLRMQSLTRREGDFVGRDLLARPAFHEESRPRLVGLRARDGQGRRFLGGAQIVQPARSDIARGYITSSTFSPTLGEWVGLGLVARAIKEGEDVLARDPVRNAETVLRVTPSIHFDPTGQRMRQ